MKNRIRSLLSALFIFLLTTALIAALSSCSSNSPVNSSGELSESSKTESSELSEETSNDAQNDEVSYTNKDLKETYSRNEATVITLKDGASTVAGAGVTITGDVINITQSGDYIISGKLSDGQIYINLPVKESVRLILEGAEITNKRSAPIYAANIKKLVITLAEGTVNKFFDADSYFFDTVQGEPNACIFSKGDITINGKGSLEVTGNYNNGIQSKDKLKIVNGNIKITAENNALKGKDLVAIKDGTLNIKSYKDGIKSDNELEAGLGFVEITGGTITIDAEKDGIQAVTSIKILGGTLNIKAKGEQYKAPIVIK
ncbi:carbohydrate-binding domain-containing protein [Eubacteriales bacterium OttesenSCG-928-G02]|nr:carbohydrate-binding domain-containing protein [Eubacteriales bacterium OttesenSCG-928-G02]